MGRSTTWLLLAVCLLSGGAFAQGAPEAGDGEQDAPAPQYERLPGDMTLAKLFDLVRQIDPQAQAQGNALQFTVRDRGLILVGDENAGRMRIMSPIARAEALDEAILQRMLQANFDAVLDARYAIANGIVWSVFIHPLAPMDEAQFANAVGQVFVAAATFGSAYTSGVLVYGGGDTNEEHRKVLQELKKQLEPQI